MMIVALWTMSNDDRWVGDTRFLVELTNQKWCRLRFIYTDQNLNLIEFV
jgi:hypothetical protein